MAYRLTAPPAMVGLFWTAFQVFVTLQIVRFEPRALGCTFQLPKTELALAVAGMAVSAVTAAVLAFTERPRPALVALSVEAACGVAWIVIGGYAAQSCILGV